MEGVAVLIFVFGCLVSVLTGAVLVACASLVRRVPNHECPAGTRRFLKYVTLGTLGTAATIALFAALIAAQWGRGEINAIRDPNVAAAVAIGMAMLLMLVVGLLFVGILVNQVRVILDVEPAQRDHGRLQRNVMILNRGGWTAIVLILGSAGIWVAVMALSVLGPLLWIFVVAPLIIPFIVVGVRSVSRRMRQGHLLWLLAIAVEKHVPLPSEIESLADSLWGKNRHRMLEFAELLREGFPMSAALEQVPDIVPRSAITTIRIGESSGTLGPTLRDLAVRHTSGMQRVNTSPSAFWLFSYFWMVISVTSLVVSFVMYYIIPKFKKIFLDFGTELPGLSLLAITMSDVVVKYSYLFLPLFAVPTVALLYVCEGYYYGWSNLRMNWLSKWILRFDTPPILRNLKRVIQSHVPLADGLGAMRQHYHRIPIRERLLRLESAAAQGIDVWDSLRQERFISKRELAILHAAARVGNLPWALSHIADSIERRQQHRLSWWFEILRMVVILAVGLLVAFICVSFFLPLVKLINDLS